MWGGPNAKLHIETADVDVCFYQYELSRELRPFFALPTVKAKFLPLGLRRRIRAKDDHQQIRFWVRVVPMGWLWAVWLIQHTHVHIISEAVTVDDWVVDRLQAVTVSTGRLAATC